MADIEISVDAGTSKRLLTAGKYCDRDILVSASGGAAEPVIQPLEVTANGVYNVPAGVDGYNPVSVNVSGSGGETGGNIYIATGTSFMHLIFIFSDKTVKFKSEVSRTETLNNVLYAIVSYEFSPETPIIEGECELIRNGEFADLTTDIYKINGDCILNTVM